MRTAAALALAGSLLLTSCGGDSKDDAKADGTGTPTPTSTVTLPPGVVLTEPGTELAFGETATVVYAPTQTLSSIVALTVKRARLGSTKDLKGFDLDTDYKKNANYYYVNVTIENLDDDDLGGRDLLLNGVNDQETLLPPVVFQSAFNKCQGKPLPKVFGQGQKFATCLVFLSPDQGPLTAVSTVTDGSSQPVTWVGDIATPEPPKKKKKQQQG